MASMGREDSFLFIKVINSLRCFLDLVRTAISASSLFLFISLIKSKTYIASASYNSDVVSAGDINVFRKIP